MLFFFPSFFIIEGWLVGLFLACFCFFVLCVLGVYLHSGRKKKSLCQLTGGEKNARCSMAGYSGISQVFE